MINFSKKWPNKENEQFSCEDLEVDFNGRLWKLEFIYIADWTLYCGTY